MLLQGEPGVGASPQRLLGDSGDKEKDVDRSHKRKLGTGGVARALACLVQGWGGDKGGSWQDAWLSKPVMFGSLHCLNLWWWYMPIDPALRRWDPSTWVVDRLCSIWSLRPNEAA